MPFFFVRYALVFCGVALVIAFCLDLVWFLGMLIAAQITGGWVGYFARRGTWLAIFAFWWASSFLIALPFARRFTGFLPFNLF
jgi:hypothetical protein